MTLRGQGPAYARALAQARRLELHHGVLLTGGRGIGKSTAAVEFAQALLCEAEQLDQACGQCNACARVASGNHADVHVLDVLEDKKDISVEQVRDLQVTLGRRSMEGSARVVIFEGAERMNEHAQNTLLKTLEEPGENTFLLLLTSRPESLLPTVRSRTHQLRLTPLDPAELEELLQELGQGDPQSRQLAAAQAGGSTGVAVELLSDGDISAVHQQLVAFLTRPNDMSAVAFSRELLAGTEGRAGAERAARVALAGLRAALRESLHASLAPPANATYLAGCHDSWDAVFNQLFEAESDLDLRIAPEQVLSTVLFGLQDALPRILAPGS